MITSTVRYNTIKREVTNPKPAMRVIILLYSSLAVFIRVRLDFYDFMDAVIHG